MGTTDGLFVIVDTEKWVLRVDDGREESMEGATMTGDAAEEDGKITLHLDYF